MLKTCFDLNFLVCKYCCGLVRLVKSSKSQRGTYAHGKTAISPIAAFFLESNSYEEPPKKKGSLAGKTKNDEAMGQNNIAGPPYVVC